MNTQKLTENIRKALDSEARFFRIKNSLKAINPATQTFQYNEQIGDDSVDYTGEYRVDERGTLWIETDAAEHYIPHYDRGGALFMTAREKEPPLLPTTNPVPASPPPIVVIPTGEPPLLPTTNPVTNPK